MRGALLWLVCGLLALGLGACSPDLNWREVQLGRLTVLLPCKPDAAQRMVQLAGQEVRVEMRGCAASGTLFAVSHTQLTDANRTSEVLTSWRLGTLAQIQRHEIKESPYPKLDSSKVGAETILQVTGIGPDGKPLAAQLAWLVDGDEIFHLAIYAPAIGAAQAEPFFEQVQRK